MNKLIFSLVLLMFCESKVNAQKLTGKLEDTTSNKILKNAVVLLLTEKDSSIYKFTRADNNGNFSFENLANGNYILLTTHPYFADFVENISIKTEDVKMGNLALTSKSKLLQEVIVKSGSPIKIKGDTTMYTADSFKVSANANVEELLKKLPGIQVDKNGKIKAMGESVEKVLVDGEEFFGDDPGMAIKNLRADAVKEVQVFDKKSDQATFTGIDDGNTQKTINLKLKEDKKRGYFGKLDAAGGLQNDIDNRYNTNAMINAFKGKRKISAFLLSGNTGQDGLDWKDNDKYGGDNDNMSVSVDEDGGVMYQWRGGGSDDEPYVDTENGFIKNTNIGINYSNKWNDKQTLNFSPKYNSQIYDNTVKRFTQAQIGDSILNESNLVNEHITRNNFKNSFSYDVKIDSMNTIKFTAKANFYNTQSNQAEIGNSTGKFGTDKNRINRTTTADIDKQAISTSILYKHKFKKPRRTISLNTDFNLLQTQNDSYLKAANQSYFNGTPSANVIQNQYRDGDKNSNRISLKAVYTEPITKKIALEIGYELSYSSGKNNLLTYDYNTITLKHDAKVDSLSNEFLQKIITNKPSFKINYTGKKIKYNVGSGFGITNFDFTDVTLNKDYTRNFTNFFPQAMFNYTYKSNHSLRFNYNGNTTQPTLNQVQPLRNNTNIYNQYIGNPDLKQSFTNRFSVSHNSYNFIKDIWTYQSINTAFTNNAITNNRTVNLDSGKTIIKPINTNGNVNVNIWSGFGFKVKKINVRFNINPSLSFNKSVGFVNSKENISRTTSGNLGIYISKEKEKKYEISIGTNLAFNKNTNTFNNIVNTFYTSQSALDAKVYYKKTWQISSDLQYLTRPKTSQLQSAINNVLWNAKLQKTFKNNEFTAYFLVRDILNQNIGVSRDFDENTFTEIQNDRLKRYWMIGFAWDFKNKQAKTK